LAKFDAAGKTPKAVLFIERIEGIKIYAGDKDKFQIPHDIGDTIKRLCAPHRRAGDEPVRVFGTGGAGPYGITWGKNVQDNDSTFMVMGLTGADLEVHGYVDGGVLQFCYPGVNTVAKLHAGEHEGIETIQRMRVQRTACRASGYQLGQQIPLLRKPGFVFVVGGLHNNWHTTYFEGLREALPPRTQLIGGVGLWEDYVYCDGRKFHDRSIAAAETVNGRLAVTLQGTDFDFYAMGGESVNKFDVEAIDRHTYDVARRLLSHMPPALQPLASPGGTSSGDSGPIDAMIAFSCVTRLRDPKIMHPAVLTEMMHRHFQSPAMELFGCFCGGEVCLTIENDFTTGGDRLACVAMRGK
ncbi:MAG: hypothetical protein IT442_14495, partial [Phycisphaeraceae bacterium]|nr:hypothetical protein [Phycisphaeraceae bacterium]